MWTGKKLEAKYGVYYRMRDESDRLCKEHSLSVITDRQRHKTARATYFAEKNGEPTRYNLMRKALDKALEMSSSWHELSDVLRKMGYVFESSPYHRYATIRSLKSKKNMRTFRLGEKYTKEALEDRLLENQRDYSVLHRYYDFMDQFTREYARENPPTEDYYRRLEFYYRATKAISYVDILTCIAVILGIAPMYEKQVQKPLSAECREACRRLDRYTAQLTLASREGFRTTEDIEAFIAEKNAEIDTVTAQRTKLRNRQRSCKDPAEKEQLKAECAACTETLTHLRKEKKTAYGIIDDSPKLKELIDCEFDARLENDPYLSEREKRQIRGERPQYEKERTM